LKTLKIREKGWIPVVCAKNCKVTGNEFGEIKNCGALVEIDRRLR
jgi:hypothetical protein